MAAARAIAPNRVAALRAASQRLHRPASGPRDAAALLRAIGGAQSQEPRAGRLQLRARSRTLTSAEIERARTDERSVVRSWLMRGTVHLVATEDIGWLLPLFSDRISAWSRRRLAQLGLSDAQRERAVEAARRALATQGPMARSEVVEVASRAGVEIDDQRRVHLFILLCAEGIACIGPDKGRESTVVATADWIGEPRRRGREESLADLARLYVRAYAPASERDFAFWSGLPLRDCRRGLERIAAECEAVTVGSETALVPRGWSARAPRSPVVRLLGAFDTYLMGYASRDHAADGVGQRRVLPGGGVLRPTICVDGRFAGIWSSKRSGKVLTVSIEPFDGFDGSWLPAIEAEVADLGRFEGAEARLA